MENNEITLSNSVPDLIGFDWNVKAVLGSSSLANLQQPLVGVDFFLGEANKTIQDLKPSSEVTSFSIEMTQAELKNLLSVLEKAVGSIS